MLNKAMQSARSYGLGTVYIHEKKVPYPYYISGPHHNCAITEDKHRHMTYPHYMLPLNILGTTMLFAVLTVGLLMVIDRARQTPVVRARFQDLQSQLSFKAVEEIVMKAIEAYNELNSNYLYKTKS